MKSKVLILIPCLNTGGTEMHTLALVQTLIGADYDVTVCAYFEHDEVTVEMIRQSGARVILLGLRRDPRRKNILQLPRLTWLLMKLMHKVRPDFVHVQYMTPGIPPLVAARMMRVSHTIATVHTPGHHFGRQKRLLPRLCDVVLCVSQSAEQSFFGNSALYTNELLQKGRRHFTIHNAVDIDDSAVTNSASSVRIGMITRLSAEKGPQDLIAAMPMIPDAHLTIVGDGSERGTLEQQAKTLGVAPRITWIGRIPKDQVRQYLKQMDIVVVPSHFEGFGLIAAEAMAAGKPVVASDVDGLREVVGPAGILVPPRSPELLAAAIAKLLGDVELRNSLGRAGRERVLQLFSMETFKRRHLQLYSQLSGAVEMSDAKGAAAEVTQC